MRAHDASPRARRNASGCHRANTADKKITEQMRNAIKKLTHKNFDSELLSDQQSRNLKQYIEKKLKSGADVRKAQEEPESAAACNVIYHFSGKAVLKLVGNEIIIRSSWYTVLRSFPISISSCSLYSVSPLTWFVYSCLIERVHIVLVWHFECASRLLQSRQQQVASNAQTEFDSKPGLLPSMHLRLS